MPHIVHRIGIKAPRAKVFEALTTIKGLAGWWTEETNGSSKPGGTISFTFKNPQGEVMGSFEMEVITYKLSEEVAWRCKVGPAEWVGTTITFELKLDKVKDMTIVNFAHRNWEKEVEFMAHCSTKWAVFLLSLRDLVEKGRGQPTPRDLKIDNWN